MNVPLLDLKRQYEEIREEMEREVVDVLRSGWYILGPNVKAFEAESAQFCGAKYGVGLNSGTDALRIALKAVGVGPGTEVITSAFSYFATCEVVTDLGATVVFADIEPDSFNIDPADIARKITPKTTAIVPIHLFGLLADMEKIREVAGDIPVIEDACQAIGATGPGGKAGSCADAAAFSFFPSKNLGAAGDGGLLTTNCDHILQETLSMRNHGTREDRYRHEIFGYNSRLDEIQAAVLRVKLRHLDDFNAKRIRNATIYNEAFSAMEGITPPVAPKGYVHVYHQYTLRVHNSKRDRLFDALGEAGIGRAIYYLVPLHRQPAYCGAYDNVPLPVSELAAKEVVSLPIFPELTDEEINYVIDIVAKTIK
jgi:dTDP-4-amino-4,6-dideoxygalactose transaminase